MTHRIQHNVGAQHAQPARCAGSLLSRVGARRILRLWCVLVGFVCAAQVSLAQTTGPSETQVKAAFLVNFPKYVTWPAEAFAETNSPIVITVLGGNKLSDELAKMVPGKKVDGRPLVLSIAPNEDQITTNCHVLFIGAAERRRAPAVLQKLGDAPVLTVGESDDFLSSGGTINLAIQDKKVSVEVNLASANKARLQISSKLLNVAHVQKDKAR